MCVNDTVSRRTWESDSHVFFLFLLSSTQDRERAFRIFVKFRVTRVSFAHKSYGTSLIKAFLSGLHSLRSCVDKRRRN